MKRRSGISAARVLPAENAGLHEEIIQTHSLVEIVSKAAASQLIAGEVIHVSNNDTVAGANSPDDIGSVCCGVRSIEDPSITGVLTAAHVYTQGMYDETYNGFMPVESQHDVLFNGKKAGKWYYKQLSDTDDSMVIRLHADALENAGLKKFCNQRHEVTDADLHAQVTVLSRNGNERQAYILRHHAGYPVKYKGISYYKTGIILIGSVKDEAHSRPVSDPGDSGGCVYIRKDGKDKLIGLLLGGDSRFTFVLPLQTAFCSLFEIV